jgi:hypothetical protein
MKTNLEKQRDAVFKYLYAPERQQQELIAIDEVLDAFELSKDEVPVRTAVVRTLDENKYEWIWTDDLCLSDKAEEDCRKRLDKILDNCTEELVNYSEGFKLARKQENQNINQNTMEEIKKPDSVQQDAEAITEQTLPVQPDEGVNDQSSKNAPEAIEGEEIGEDGKPAKKQGKGEMPSMRVNNQESAVENAGSNFMGAYKAVTRKIPEDKMAMVCSTLEKLGCDLAKMKENGDLQRIQDGKKTENLYEVKNPRLHKDGQSEYAKISFWLDQNGEPVAYTHGVIQNPKFEEFKGHKFTSEQQESLRSVGSAGELIPITFKEGEDPVYCIISRDRKTNRLYAIPENQTKIIGEILGVQLTQDQMHQLKLGKAIEVEGMKSKFDGKEFTGKVCYNAERGGLEVNAKKPFIIGKILGIEPTQEEKDILRDKGVIRIERTKDDGTIHNIHVRLNAEQTRLQFCSEGKFLKLRHQLSDKQMAEVDRGWTVKANLTDKKGQTYVAFVRKNAETGKMEQSKDGTFQKKATALGYQQQVNANNEGIAPDKETQKAINDGVVAKKGETARQLTAKYKHGKNSKYLPKVKM